MSECVFCKIVEGESWAARIYEDEEHIALMGVSPFSVGHTLVIPKNHYVDMFEMSIGEVSKLYAFSSIIARAVKLALKADGITIIQNNGATTGQKIFHVHVHIIPSYSNRPFIMKWEKVDLSREELVNTASKIRQQVLQHSDPEASKGWRNRF